MREFRISFPSEGHMAMVNSGYMSDKDGRPMSEFPVMIKDERLHVMEIISDLTMCSVAIFAISHGTVGLILNLETGQVYNVDYDKRGHSHTFPTTPPVSISLVDF